MLPSGSARQTPGSTECISESTDCCSCDLGGFTPDELLKIWKGLFYCMWMQDKPLQQVSEWQIAEETGQEWMDGHTFVLL